MSFVDPVRHCASCAEVSNTEVDFFTKHVKVLMSGKMLQNFSFTSRLLNIQIPVRNEDKSVVESSYLVLD